MVDVLMCYVLLRRVVLFAFNVFFNLFIGSGYVLLFIHI